jgi:hypothetical protein
VPAVEAQDADGQGLRRLAMVRGGGAGADLGGVLGEGNIADVMQRLDAPVASQVVGEAGGVGLGGGEVGDRVGGHGAPPPAGKRPDSAGDADRLGGVGEVEASDVGDLQAADLGAAVTSAWRQRGVLLSF